MGLYKIFTYGCQMNEHESEKLAGQLEKLGYKKTDEVSLADIIVFNTCTIRETAVSKIYGNIGAIKHYKELNKKLIVAVGGCMTQDRKEAETLKKKLPFVDIIFGTHNVNSFSDMVEEYLKSGAKVCELTENADTSEGKMVRTSFPNAWVNITYGCNNFCSYCIVPYVRGREVSRPFDEVVSEVEALLSEGYKEITLLGQNVNSYGNDIMDENVNFSALLNALGALPYKYRLRFMSSHPKDLSKEVVDAIKSNGNICKYIHLPLQSGSDEILSKMNRKYTASDYMQKIAMIKDAIPNCALTTDIIVGFPTETEEDFQKTISLVSAVRFYGAFTFIYSKRAGTVAEKMDGQIERSVKSERIGRLIKVQNLISKQISDEYIGKTVEILVEDFDEAKNAVSGKTDSGKMVTATGTADLLGKFVDVKIKSTTISALKGEIV